jgi:hypothetical protein
MIVLLREGLSIKKDIALIRALNYPASDIFVNNKFFYSQLPQNYKSFSEYAYIFKIPRLLRKGDLITSGKGLFLISEDISNANDTIRVIAKEIDLPNTENRIEFELDINYVAYLHQITLMNYNDFTNTIQAKIYELSIQTLYSSIRNLLFNRMPIDYTNFIKEPYVFEINNEIFWGKIKVIIKYETNIDTKLGIIFEVKQK